MRTCEAFKQKLGQRNEKQLLGGALCDETTKPWVTSPSGREPREACVRREGATQESQMKNSGEKEKVNFERTCEQVGRDTLADSTQTIRVEGHIELSAE